ATSTPQTDEQADDVANVLALAAHRGPATDFIRQSSPPGACALVKLGHSPTATIARAVRAVLPGFTVMTIARTLDQFTGLCSLEMRSPPTRGAVLVVSIASPGGRSRAVFDSVRIGFETTADASTKYVLTVTRGGWSVLIGATGIGAALPSAQDMLELARQPMLTW
ncbi:MAG: hypothetical protein ACRDWE_09905, partial [Acidimicrobiales bacterium]